MADKVHIVRAEQSKEFKDTVTHPWNPANVVAGTQLARNVGLERLRVNVVRVPPNGAASVYHTHQTEEEWLYVLEGKGVIEIDDHEYFLSPGDFAGFPAGSAPRQLRNPFSSPLICLQGGENQAVDITDFPRMGKRMYRHGDTVEVYDTADAEEIAPADLDEVVTTSWRRSLARDRD